MERVEVKVQKRLTNGRQLSIKFSGPVEEQDGDDAEVAEMLLEAEMYGNSRGGVRIHIFSEIEQ